MRIDRVKFAAALARADFNVKQLAECSGVSRATISSVKTGKSCSKDTAYKLAKVLGHDIIENTAATKTKQSSRKYVCPVCGCIIRATKEVHVICGDCNVEFEEEA